MKKWMWWFLLTVLATVYPGQESHGFGHETKDYRVGMMVTAGDSHRINKGALLAPKKGDDYFREALFSHLSILHPRSQGQQGEGVFIPVFGDKHSNNIDAIAQMTGGGIRYSMDDDDLLQGLKEMGLHLPDGYHLLTPVHKVLVEAETISSGAGKRNSFYLMETAPLSEEDLGKTPLPDYRIGRSQQSILVEFGNRDELDAEAKLIQKNDGAAGALVFGKHYHSLPLKIEVYTIEAEDDRSSDGSKKEQFKFQPIVGRYLIWHKNPTITQGALIRPVLGVPQPGFGFAAEKTEPLSTSDVRLASISKQASYADIELDARALLDKVIAPVAFSAPTFRVKHTSLECILANGSSFTTACQKKEGDEEMPYVIRGRLALEGSAEQKPITFWVRPKGSRSIGYRIEITTDPKPPAELPAKPGEGHVTTWNPKPEEERE